MVQNTKKVFLNLVTNQEVAREVATAVLMRANPHDSQLVEDKLQESDITIENLMKYFVELTKATAEFWNNQYDMRFQMTMKAHELRGLFLPVVYGVIFASVGNVTVGNYEYIVKAREDDVPDREFLINFSAKLEGLRQYVKGNIGQIGTRGAQPQNHVMLCVMGKIADDYRTARLLVRDGVQVDTAFAGLSALAGVSLVEESLTIMYTGEEEVNFRQVVDGLVDRGLMANRSTDSNNRGDS